MSTLPNPGTEDMIIAAVSALRDAGVRTQASARAMLAMWARLGQLDDAQRAEVLARFDFEPACDFGDVPNAMPTAVPMGPNTFGLAPMSGDPLPPVVGNR